MLKLDKNYKNWLSEIKSKVKSAQAKAAVAVNSTLIEFYWDLGKMIVEKQSESSWGDKLLNQLSSDLQEEFPNIGGLSRRNMEYCRQFYKFYVQFNQQAVDQDKEEQATITQQAVAQLEHTVNHKDEIRQQLVAHFKLNKIPWGQNILVFTKSKSLEEALFYVNETINNAWSRETLALQIKTDLYHRQGKAINNFDTTLSNAQAELAQQTLKDPYVFGFLSLEKPFHERDIEKQLVQNVSKFLLELGKGFAFIGQQYHLEVADNDYYIDLLFYHVVLKCYVVIELKNTKFLPEYAGKMNFYLSAVDSYVKNEDDKPTIGILLCREKNNIEAEFAMRDLNKPMGVSEFQFADVLPENLKSSLPTIEEIEKELSEWINENDSK